MLLRADQPRPTNRQASGAGRAPSRSTGRGIMHLSDLQLLKQKQQPTQSTINTMQAHCNTRPFALQPALAARVLGHGGMRAISPVQAWSMMMLCAYVHHYTLCRPDFSQHRRFIKSCHGRTARPETGSQHPGVRGGRPTPLPIYSSFLARQTRRPQKLVYASPASFETSSSPVHFYKRCPIMHAYLTRLIASSALSWSVRACAPALIH